MADTIPPPVTRATAVFAAGPAPSLHCSNCDHAVADDDPDCPTCDSPLDWTASADALRAWKDALDGQ